MAVIYYLFLKIPRPFFVLLALLFLVTVIVGMGHNANDHRNTQEIHHVHADRSSR